MSLITRAATESHLPSSTISNLSSTTSFTSHLRETILQSRSIIDTWVINEKKRVDQHVKEAKQEVAAKQRIIDTTSAKLLALQLQYGCQIGNDDPQMSNGNNNKLSEQQAELETKIQLQTKKNQSLDVRLAELKKHIKGNVIVIHAICF